MPTPQTYADLIREQAKSRFTDAADLEKLVDVDATLAYIVERIMSDEAPDALCDAIGELSAPDTRLALNLFLTVARNPETATYCGGQMLALLLPAFKRSIAEHWSRAVEIYQHDHRDPWAEIDRREEARA
jgi:hypothetical protein